MQKAISARLIGLCFMALLAASTLAWCVSAQAEAAKKQFVINDPSKRDVIAFESDAPLELIQGQTNAARGLISFDENFQFDAKHPFKIAFEVDLASIDTGIPLRNEHMRDNFLETGKFPKARFVATSINMKQKPPFKLGQTVDVTATGNFTLHGKTVRKTVPLKVTYFPESAASKNRFKAGNIVRVKGKFPVRLEDHGIKRPEVIFQKLAETVYVSVDLTGTDNPKAAGVAIPTLP
ncbi:MAG: YceI family protein [Candidatus Melainabacteria bacterium]|nr:YceI family protein [Candidatus Melainabacteria bacterium]